MRNEPDPGSSTARSSRGLLLASLLGLALAACGRDPAEDPPAAPPAVTTAAAPARPAPAAHGDETWNAAAIDWQPYEAGLARAKAQSKPVCLVLYANWCPHCRNFSKVFDDPRIVERARDFVMIKINSDEQTEINRRYALDGGYVPRTYFLASDGTPLADVHAPRPKYIYFYDERNPASLLGGMSEALRKVAAR
jgi:protein-disulfide reductase (glutathione)